MFNAFVLNIYRLLEVPTLLPIYLIIVAKQAIERHLVAPLSEVFSLMVLARYSDKEVHFLASEPPEWHRYEKLGG